MAVKEKLPMGIENFKEMRTQGYYYVDKTGLIRDFLENFGKVNLFTRPRRFGKTLNMSMLKCFFEMGDGNSRLFEGLAISMEKELCEEYMGKFPVISITLKGVRGRSFEEAKGMLRNIIGNEAMCFQFLLQSDRLTAAERKRYEALINSDHTGIFTMSDELLKDSLLTLSQFLQKHYEQNGVIEIEEQEIGIVIELKYAEKAAFEDGCRAALQQIEDRNYEERLVDDGMKTIYRYGIACYKKRCKVVSSQCVRTATK